MIPKELTLDMHGKPSGVGQFADIFDKIMSQHKPEVIVEVGVRTGISTGMLLHCIKDRPKCKLYSIDKDECNEAKDKFVDNEQWKFIMGDDIIIVRNWDRDYPFQIDLLFLDGDHGHDHVLNELIEWTKFLRSGGTVIIHDTNDQDEWKAVTEFLSTLCKRNFELKNYVVGETMGDALCVMRIW